MSNFIIRCTCNGIVKETSTAQIILLDHLIEEYNNRVYEHVNLTSEEKKQRLATYIAEKKECEKIIACVGGKREYMRDEPNKNKTNNTADLNPNKL